MSGLRVEDLAVIRRARADALAAELRAEATVEAEEDVDGDAASIATEDARVAASASASAAAAAVIVENIRPAPGADGEGPAPSKYSPVAIAAAAAAAEMALERSPVASRRASVDAQHASSSRGVGGRAEAGRQLEAEQTLMRAGVATHARRGESSEAVIDRLQTQLRVLQEDKVVGELMDAAKEELIEGLQCELARLRREQERMLAAQAAADALQQKLALLETDLGAFWRAPLGSEDSHTTLSRSVAGSDAAPSLESSLMSVGTEPAGGGEEQNPNARAATAAAASARWNDAYGLTDVRESADAPRSPLKSLAKIITAARTRKEAAENAAAAAKTDAGTNAAAATAGVAAADETEVEKSQVHAESDGDDAIPADSSPVLSPLSERTAARRDRSRSRGGASFGSVGDGKENFPFGRGGFVNPFSEAALAAYAAEAEADAEVDGSGHGKFGPEAETEAVADPSAEAVAEAVASTRSSRGEERVESWASDQTFRALDDSQVRRKERAAMAAAFAAASALAASEEEEAYRAAEAASAAAAIRSEHLASPHRRVKSTGSTIDSVTSPRASYPPASAVAERAAHAAVKLEKTTLKRQLEGLKTRFREVQSEANTTREALDGYRDTVQRVEFQKRLLCAQVLELEAKLSEREEERERLLRRERESLRRGSETRLVSVSGRSPDALADSWAGPPTANFFLPKIVRMWRELRVPLLHRSQFLLAFRGRETFYFEAEHRRLTWLKSSLAAEGWTPEESEGDLGGLSQFLAEGGFGRGYARANPTRGATASASAPARLRAAERALRRERADLRRLARRLEKPQLDAIFAQWSIPVHSKRRKARLVETVWSDAACDAAADAERGGAGAGMVSSSSRRTRSNRRGGGGGAGGGSAAEAAADDCFARLRRHAELVLQLRGMDATEDMFDLVFKSTSTSAASSMASSIRDEASRRLRAVFASPVKSLGR